jgi:hypothetical protein
MIIWVRVFVCQRKNMTVYQYEKGNQKKNSYEAHSTILDRSRLSCAKEHPTPFLSTRITAWPPTLMSKKWIRQRNTLVRNGYVIVCSTTALIHCFTASGYYGTKIQMVCLFVLCYHPKPTPPPRPVAFLLFLVPDRRVLRLPISGMTSSSESLSSILSFPFCLGICFTIRLIIVLIC